MIRMRLLHMSLEIHFVDKLVRTQVTVVISDVGMLYHVTFQVGAGGDSFVADLAVIRVDPNVAFYMLP